MKPALMLLFYVPFVFLFSFHPQQNSFTKQSIAAVDVQKDSTTKIWINDFKSFRDAIYQHDTAKVKTFFKFPVLNPANEIWFLVLSEKQREAKKLTDKIAPFTEKDFNKYYKKLFPNEFTQTLLKIKSAELFNKGETASPEIKDGDTTTKMYASVDKETNILSLSLSYTIVWKEESGEVQDGGESTVIYSFKILQNGHLQFMYVRLAG